VNFKNSHTYIILFHKRKYINVAIFFIILALSNQNNFPYEPVR
jgi:hypothetical protein